MLTRNGPSGSLQMRVCPVANGRSWRTTRIQGTAVGIWRLRETCRRLRPWPRASVWRIWSPRMLNTTKVPTYLYKLVYDATTQRAWAHWQENREGETVGRPISYQELVKRTGVEFLPRSALQH